MSCACPACHSVRVTVSDSRPSGSTTRRRRKCLACGERWTTFEVSAAAFSAITEIRTVLATAHQALNTASRQIDALKDEGLLLVEDYELPQRGRLISERTR